MKSEHIIPKILSSHYSENSMYSTHTPKTVNRKSTEPHFVHYVPNKKYKYILYQVIIFAFCPHRQ